MATPQTTRPPHRHRTRLATGLIALSALIAIGVSLLFLALPGAHQTATPTATSEHPQSAPASIAAPSAGGYYYDPTMHALIRTDTEQCGSAHPRNVCTMP